MLRSSVLGILVAIGFACSAQAACDNEAMRADPVVRSTFADCIRAQKAVIDDQASTIDDLKKALEENAAVNKALLAKLETIDTRLGTVEKTLTDIQ